jgi:formylglycine-generating enzyme required for sulfatase activity
MMGSPALEAGYSNGETQHKVTISRNFEMQPTVVTQMQWFSVMATNPSHFKDRSSCEGEQLEKDGVALCPNAGVLV